MSEDNGLGSTASKGLGSFFFAAIPWVLAGGASAWLAFYMAFHNDKKELAQEDRKSVYVGAEIKPTGKIGISVKHTMFCVKITRADFDEPNILIYAQNECADGLSYMEWHWALVSPDNTVLKSGYTNWQCPIPSELHQKAECQLETRSTYESAEDRAAHIEVWVKGSG